MMGKTDYGDPGSGQGGPWIGTLVALLVGVLVSGSLVGVAAQDYPELSRAEEMRLALSAGPLSVSSDADVYVMQESGFTRVREGENGWACLVVRSASNRSILAPHCLNPPAVETVLPSMLREGQLQARGMEADAIEAELRRQYSSNELPLPSGPAYAYMVSEGQRLGTAGNFKPHFMLYIPYITNAAIGGDPAKQEFPFVGPIENHPLSTVVIIMDEFVDPDDVVMPGR